MPVVLCAQHASEVVEVQFPGDSLSRRVVHDQQLYAEKWDTLSQIRFWHKIMNSPPEVSFINIAATRQILDSIPTELYDGLSSLEKKVFKDSILVYRGMPMDTRVYITAGKGHYYNHRAVVPDIDKAVEVFLEEGVDPWYAQAILLIESPGKLRKSSAGAYGPFQLLRGVAIRNGLTVNREVDERADVARAAWATARFMRRVCIPETRRLLKDMGLAFDESSVWFRLMVLHVYHAGAGNVRGVMRTINPQQGGIPLVNRLWQTQYRRFGNSSQNYSQIALASLIEFDRLVSLYQDKQPKEGIPPLKPIALPQPTRIPHAIPARPVVSSFGRGM
ncbi:MAG: lytic transglycosylase domain-containing protein [Bacteroidetes bacterium]|nr:MAG: lytic transglycosylase domain-containing protein [Bacteroidota bacterium]